jgi:hypothetical protein
MSKFTIEQAAMVRRAYFNAKRALPEEDMLFALNTVLGSAPDPQALTLQQKVALEFAVALGNHGKFGSEAIEEAFVYADYFLAHKEESKP